MPTRDKPPVPTPSPPPAIRVGFGSFVLELPKWLIDRIKHDIVLWLFVCLTLLNLYFTYATRNGAGLFVPGAREGEQSAPAEGKQRQTLFAKTFIFWVPDFSSPTEKLPDSRVAEEQFHKALTASFGGWTRWRATGAGAGSTGTEDGWIYQTSLPKAAPNLSTQDVEKLIRRHFLEASIYVIEVRHQ